VQGTQISLPRVGDPTCARLLPLPAGKFCVRAAGIGTRIAAVVWHGNANRARGRTPQHRSPARSPGGDISGAIVTRSPPPALLFVADSHGTLAAVRSLGRAGIPVTVADWRRLVPARWSRYATRGVDCPSFERGGATFVEWLLSFGKRRPGHVLLATTDDLAWLFARHARELEQHFRLATAPIDAMDTLLNKWRLSQACAGAGLTTPQTVLAGSNDALAPPLLIKPQSQVLFHPHHKGLVVTDLAALETELTRFRAGTRYDPSLLAFDSRVAVPMLQAFVDVRRYGTYSLSGFVDDDHLVVKASRKVLQRPFSVGVGLCFEAAPVEEGLAHRIAALCRHLGHRGVFEVELLDAGERRLLVDFNPRFFGQMAFDIARGADLPLLAYLLALGNRRRLAKVVDVSRVPAADAPRAWCDRITLACYLSALRLTQAFSRHDAAYWRRWLDTKPHDAVLDAGDVWPTVVAAGQTLLLQLAHPRSTLRAATVA
jgi:predicted ATP-grasp superfamily ATP-dependent carboligase